MRRTRHVVLPVRSWEHVGLMVVSLACLTLGLVSRDREGQAGSLAGPDLQHCAPHKFDACPNENVFTRLLFYDDLANPSGLNPTDHPVKDRDRSNQHRDTTSPVIQKERSSSDIRNFRSTRQASVVSVSRSDARRSNDHRDVRLSGLGNDRRGNRVKDSRTAERISMVRNQRTSTERRINPTESRREERSRQIRSFRSRERESVDKDSRLETERRQAHLSDRQTERLLRFKRSSERDSERGNDRLVAERRNDRSARRVRESRSLDRDAAIRNNIRLSNERRDNRLDRQVRSTRFIERSDNLIAERRNNVRNQRDQIARSIRSHSSSKRSERLSEQSAERRDTRIFGQREDRVTREIRKVRAIDQELFTPRTDRSIERKGDRRVREIRSSNGDFVVRNSRLIPEISNDRSAHRSRNARSLDRVADVKRNTQDTHLLTSERRDDRLTRQIRTVRSTRDSETRNTRRVTERRNVHLTPESRGDQRAQRARVIPTLKRDFERGNTDQLSARRTDRQSNEIRVRDSRTHSSVEHDSRARNIRAPALRRENRFTRVFRDISLNERRPTIIDSRLAAERIENRQKREIRSLERDSRIRNSERISEQRDRRQSRQAREVKTINRDNSERITRDSLTRNLENRVDFFAAERRVSNQNRRLGNSRSLQRSSSIRSLRAAIERRNAISSSEYRDDRVTHDARIFRSVAEGRGERQQIQRAHSLRFTERASRVRIGLIKNERASIDSLRNSRNIRTDFIAREARTGRNERSSRYTRQNNVDRLISVELRSSRVERTIENRRVSLQTSKDPIKIEKLSAKREQVRYAGARAEKNREIQIRRTRATRLSETFRLQENSYGTRDNSNLQDARRLLFASTLTPQIPKSTTYEILRQTAVLILCAAYAASLQSGKGSLSRNIITYFNRLVVW